MFWNGFWAVIGGLTGLFTFCAVLLLIIIPFAVGMGNRKHKNKNEEMKKRYRIIKPDFNSKN